MDTAPDEAHAESHGAAALAHFVRRHPRLFVLTGAGCSAASGIPTYRDDQGQWRRQPPVPIHEFLQQRQARRRYWARSLVAWPQFRSALPNAAHLALADLERRGFVHGLVTQNVDRLHQRAGSRRVTDLHGRIDRVSCTRCGHRESRDGFQHRLTELNPEFRPGPAPLAPDGDADLALMELSAFRIPCCSMCRGIMKTDVVFYGENVPRSTLGRAVTAMQGSDAVLIVGSSLTVYSGYRFCRWAWQAHKPVAAINLGRTRADHGLTLKLSHDCGRSLSELLQRLA